MSKNILLDTNILKNLVSRTEFSPYLKQIMVWQERGDIVVFYPETLKGEWEKHREEELKKISDVIRKHQHTIKVSELFNSPPDIGEPQLEIADRRLKAQVNEIDKILESAVQISNENIAAGRMWEQKKKSRAPFRTKKNSFNDAIILFATLEELVRLEEKELYFFSENHTDFAAPGNEELIHPDISTIYPSISINYYSNVVKGLAELVELGLPSAKKELSNGKYKISKFFTEDLSKNIVEQLGTYINKRFNDIEFLPKRLFCFHSPLMIGDEFKEVQKPFVLQTDNEKVYDLFLKFAEKDFDLSLKDDERTESDYSIMELSRFLRRNLVNEITYNNQKVKIPVQKVNDCECAVCNFGKLKFSTSYAMLSTIESEAPTLKNAYVFYLHGNWKMSISILLSISEMAEKEKKWLTYYIAKYNLLLLGRLLRFQDTKSNFPELLLMQLREINMVYVFKPT
ncbi:hypothetical protein AB670_03743 [Chryseobacterium sp. MOF25P]|uniref:PIN domain-containing protein n=1 Tax=unclassified Chryseobacterium TaxID=2593645 RepID=UPI000805E05C|nr:MULTISPECIES: PIN domain-containing protein [unclassified Chryseobacterium]OBW39897.1 hypothetical protein AB670_03743 [Chryseobacterium sp. MOF25P]OBW43647.1 hypothetical protein AB671_04288 [Chryseobacterium sp. BGARF1]